MMTDVGSPMAEELEIMPEEGKRGRTVRAGEVWIEVRVPREAKAQLDEWAKVAGVSASLIMRRLLMEALATGRAERGELP